MDALIPGYVRRAALWMERNYSFQYMHQFYLLNIDLEVATTPRYVEWGPGVPKSILLFRWVNEDGEYTNLKRIDPRAQNALVSGTPSAYWLDGIRRIVLATTPDENLNGELQLVKYTPWPAEETFTHWLIDRAEDVLLAQTLMLMATRLRDDRLIATWKATRDEGLDTLIRAEEEILYNDRDSSIEYTPAGEWS